MIDNKTHCFILTLWDDLVPTYVYVSFCDLVGYQFDFLNWFYWNLWWQHYSYWSMMLQCPQMMGPTAPMGFNPPQFTGPPGMGVGPETGSGSNNTTQQQQWNNNQPVWNGMYAPPIPHPNAPGQFQYQQPQQPGIGIGQIHIRIITGEKEIRNSMLKVNHFCTSEVFFK